MENNEQVKLKFLLGILNSKFFRFYYSKLSQVEGTTKPQIYLNILKSMPVPKFNQDIVRLVDKMLNLNKKIANMVENSNEWKKLKDEIKKIDKKIDEEIYRLYYLTSEEIKITENFK